MTAFADHDHVPAAHFPSIVLGRRDASARTACNECAIRPGPPPYATGLHRP